MPGSPSKLSRALADDKLQLKSKKTRGANPRELTLEEVTALELERDGLLGQMRAAAKERAVNRINAHTTAAADAAADRVIESQKRTN